MENISKAFEMIKKMDKFEDFLTVGAEVYLEFCFFRIKKIGNFIVKI